MNIEKIIANVKFEYGWCYEMPIFFFEKESNIQIVFDAYSESEKITPLQERYLSDFFSHIEDITVKINAEINSYMNTYLEDSWTIQNDLQLSEIFIKQDGRLILLCEANWDKENDLGIQIFPTYEIGPQDTFL